MSQYRCGQGHPTPIHTQCLPTYTHTKKKHKKHPFWTDGRTDKASYRVVSPQLKREEEKEEDGEEKQR